MSLRIALACGAVSWERELIDAITARPGAEVAKRYVELRAVVADLRTDFTPDVIITSPGVRGFSEKLMQQCLASGVRVIVLLDGIRPPWIFESALELVEVADSDFADIVAGMLDVDDVNTSRSFRWSNVTAVLGVSGGVGATTMAWLLATAHPNALLVELNAERPSATLLVGSDAADGTLRKALIGAPTSTVAWTQSMFEPETLSDAEVAALLSDAAATRDHVVVDLGANDAGASAQCAIAHAGTLLVIAEASPVSLIRLLTLLPLLEQSAGKVAVVINRVRDSVADSRHTARVISDLVASECGAHPILIEDRAAECDAGWLRSDWSGMRDAAAQLVFAESRASRLVDGAQHYEAA